MERAFLVLLLQLLLCTLPPQLRQRIYLLLCCTLMTCLLMLLGLPAGKLLQDV